MRITQGMLEQTVKIINKRNGIENPNYGTVGAYRIDYAYGGVSLELITSEGGAVKDIFRCGHTTKRDLYNRITAYMEGMDND